MTKSTPTRTRSLSLQAGGKMLAGLISQGFKDEPVQGTGRFRNDDVLIYIRDLNRFGRDSRRSRFVIK